MNDLRTRGTRQICAADDPIPQAPHRCLSALFRITEASGSKRMALRGGVQRKRVVYAR